MEAKELRIGNIVMIENEIIKVNSRMIFHFSESGLIGKPIPLTEEWLLKLNAPNVLLGFELIKHGRIRYANDYGDTLNADYVHELQNLYFALTGTELEIK